MMNYWGTDKPRQFFHGVEVMIEERGYFLGQDYYYLEDEVVEMVEEHYIYNKDTKELLKAFLCSLLSKG